MYTKHLCKTWEKIEGRSREEEDDSIAVGHFCAPFSPGFCEANFCIFHNPREVQNE